jgi:hypothetical protein
MAEARIDVAARYEDLDALPSFATDFPNLTKPVTPIAPHPYGVTVPYAAQKIGVTVIPDATTATTATAVSFGGVVDALAFEFRNRSGQELGIQINAATDLVPLPDGGVIVLAANAAAATPITSLHLVATATQTGDGEVDVKIFGTDA